MVHRPVIPDGQVILILPPESDLQIMVLRDQVDKPPEEVLRLVLAQPVDLLHVVTDGEDALPPGDRVGPDHGVDGLEELAHILWGAALGGVDLEAVAVSGLVEAGLGVGGRQAVEEGS